VSWHQLLTSAIPKSAMTVSAVPLMDAIKILENALLPLTMIDAVITTNAPSIDVLQQDALILLLFVMTVMLAPLTNVIQELENAFTPQWQPPIQIFATSKLVMQRKE
jgi:glucan phosphoethanolaminetransferase (alkaline phosphatase superfamily)